MNELKKKYLRIIQIKSRKKGWRNVEFVGINNSGKLILRSSNGEIFTRKQARTRWFGNYKLYKIGR